jgi:hypothetical protein
MNLISPLGGPTNVIAPGSTVGSIALLIGTALMAFMFTTLMNISVRAIRAAHLIPYVVGISTLAWIALAICWTLGDSRHNSSWSLLTPTNPADKAFAAIYGIWLAALAIATILGTTAGLRQTQAAARRARRRMHALRVSAAFGTVYAGLIAANAIGVVDWPDREITIIAEAITAPAVVAFIIAVL